MNTRRKEFFWSSAMYLAPLAVGLILATLMLVGCATSGDAGSDEVPELAGTRWTITRIDGKPPEKGEPLTAYFGVDGRINGDGGCNNFSGPFIQTGSTVQIGELMSTRRACTDSARQRQENRLIALLQGTTKARLNRDQLTLSAESGSLVLVPGSFVANVGYPRRVQYDCEGVGLTVTYERESAELTWSDGRDMLMQRPAASGVWYQSTANTWRGKQDMTWTQTGRSPRTCRELR